MNQRFTHIQAYHIEDLCYKISCEIEERNEYGYFLSNIQYSNLESNEGDCHAFLLFNEVVNGQEMDSGNAYENLKVYPTKSCVPKNVPLMHALVI